MPQSFKPAFHFDIRPPGKSVRKYTASAGGVIYALKYCLRNTAMSVCRKHFLHQIMNGAKDWLADNIDKMKATKSN
jgi:hypothetical protein